MVWGVVFAVCCWSEPLTEPARIPVRACFALCGAGSLGTFVSGALREVMLAIRGHNAALLALPFDPKDPRLLRDDWGRITIDAVGGASAGALCAGQLVKAIFEPSYLGDGGALDAPNTMTGDWIENASFERLSVDSDEKQQVGDIEAPGWTLLNATKLYEVAYNALTPTVYPPEVDAVSPLPAHGMIGVGITLTDILGYHEHAEFDARHVLGHPQFGAQRVETPHYHRLDEAEVDGVRDLGVKKHAEIRRFFVTAGGPGSDTMNTSIRRFLHTTQRDGLAHSVHWGASTETFAKLAAASAALPLALGPVAVTDHNEEAGISLRRIYMDGGVLNNKPLAPALQMARWHDELRLLACRDPETGEISPADVLETLDYQRVCFFLDAFPDRTRREWRSPHPNTALDDPLALQLRPENCEARDERIDAALATPTGGMAMFFDSLLSSLRAQDIRDVANMNLKVEHRRSFLLDMSTRGLVGRPDVRITNLATAHAYATVCDALRGVHVTHPQTMALTELLKSVESFSGTSNRREVTMVPVFAPKNLVDVLAGEALYAVGGLLSREARLHDANVGRDVARAVMGSLRGGETIPVTLPETPEEARPNDSHLLVERLRKMILATIEGTGGKQSFIKSLVAFPVKLNPLVKLLKTRLDRTIRGASLPDGGGK